PPPPDAPPLPDALPIQPLPFGVHLAEPHHQPLDLFARQVTPLVVLQVSEESGFFRNINSRVAAEDESQQRCPRARIADDEKRPLDRKSTRLNSSHVKIS